MAIRHFAVVVVAFTMAACSTPDTAPPGTSDTTQPTTESDDGCANVTDVEAESSDDGTWRFDVTVSSADTGWDKYADLWGVRAPDGSILGERVLTHPHENEQPFTRSLDGFAISDEITTVEVAARDSVEGFCGETVIIDLS